MYLTLTELPRRAGSLLSRKNPGTHACRKDTVFGVLYEIPDHLLSRDTAGERKSFDAIEGRRYQRHAIRVSRVDDPQTPTTAWTYTVINKHAGLRTSLEYARHILDGLREHQAPQDYIDHVRSRITENNPDLQGQI